MKKVVLVFMVIFITIGIIACKKGDTSSAKAGTGVTEFPGGWKPTHDYKNNLTFAIANVGVTEGYDYTNGDAYVRWFANAFNAKFELTGMGWDNWTELLRIWISSGDMPDVAIFDYTQQTHPDAASWVEQGLLKKLPDNWKQRWPNLARVFEKTTLGPQLEKSYGGTYFLPRSRFDLNLPHYPLPDHVSFVFRKDWAEAVGFPVKDVYKTSEIIQYGQLIAQHDPGKLGAKLVPISNRPNWAMRLFMLSNFQHMSTFYKDKKDGKYKWGPAADETLAGLKLFYRAYSTGALNREFYTLKGEEDYDQFRVSGVSGGFYGEATTYHLQMARQSFDKNLGLKPDDCIAVATIVGEDGYYHLEDLINYWGVHLFNPKISNEKFERWLDMLDFVATDPGFYMGNFGLEGIDWKRGNSPDEIISLLPPGMDLAGPTGKYPSILGFGNNIKQGDDLSFINPNFEPWVRAASKRLYDDRSRLSTPDTLTEIDWPLFYYDSPARRRAGTLDFQVEYANLVTRATSEANLEQLWKAWVTAQMPIIQPALDELNSKLR